MKNVMLFVVLLVVGGLLASTTPAAAGGLLGWLIGEKPSLLRFPTEECDADINLRHPDTLNEMTFDLAGDGQRVVWSDNISVERGLLAVGMVCPKAGYEHATHGVARLDGSETLLRTVDGPRPDDDQELWLRHVVEEARYDRQTKGFRGFQTRTPPFFFVLDTSLLMIGPHSVEFRFWTGKHSGAGVVLTFRIVRPIDEDTGETVLSEYESPTAWQGSGGPQGPCVSPRPSGASSPSFGSVEYTAPQQGMPCWDLISSVARFVGYGGVAERPLEPCSYELASSRAGSMPLVCFFVSHGRILDVGEFEFLVNGRPWKVAPQPQNRGVLFVGSGLRPGFTVAPVVGGEALPEFVVQQGRGIWYPVPLE